MNTKSGKQPYNLLFLPRIIMLNFLGKCYFSLSKRVKFNDVEWFLELKVRLSNQYQLFTSHQIQRSNTKLLTKFKDHDDTLINFSYFSKRQYIEKSSSYYECYIGGKQIDIG